MVLAIRCKRFKVRLPLRGGGDVPDVCEVARVGIVGLVFCSDGAVVPCVGRVGFVGSSVGLVISFVGSEVGSFVGEVVLVELSIMRPVMQFLPKIFAW